MRQPTDSGATTAPHPERVFNVREGNISFIIAFVDIVLGRDLVEAMCSYGSQFMGDVMSVDFSNPANIKEPDVVDFLMHAARKDDRGHIIPQGFRDLVSQLELRQDYLNRVSKDKSQDKVDRAEDDCILELYETLSYLNTHKGYSAPVLTINISSEVSDNGNTIWCAEARAEGSSDSSEADSDSDFKPLRQVEANPVLAIKKLNTALLTLHPGREASNAAKRATPPEEQPAPPLASLPPYIHALPDPE